MMIDQIVASIRAKRLFYGISIDWAITAGPLSIATLMPLTVECGIDHPTTVSIDTVTCRRDLSFDFGPQMLSNEISKQDELLVSCWGRRIVYR